MAKTHGNRIGMLLDLDQGSMTVWKNDEKLGVMQAEGLSGPLCWAVSMLRASARIESAPASPTEEELVMAATWRLGPSSDDRSESDGDEAKNRGTVCSNLRAGYVHVHFVGDCYNL